MFLGSQFFFPLLWWFIIFEVKLRVQQIFIGKGFGVARRGIRNVWTVWIVCQTIIFLGFVFRAILPRFCCWLFILFLVGLVILSFVSTSDPWRAPVILL